MASDMQGWITTALTVIGSTATATLWVGKRVDNMITKRVKEQVREAMTEVTKATSDQLNDLRKDIRQDLQDQQHQAEKRVDGITQRLDALMMRLQRP